MKARPVRCLDGMTRRLADPAKPMVPQRIEIDGDTYWISSANGCAAASVTAVGATDFRTGALSLVVYQDARPGLPDGIALARTMTPDDAEEFAHNLLTTARAIRAFAQEQAEALLRKAAGK